MEAFEHVARVFLESQGYVVSSNLKFPVTRPTRKKSYEESQTHGYEVDLVGARADRLLLCSCKSFFGSHGASRSGFKGLSPSTGKEHGKYWLFNDDDIVTEVTKQAAKKYGYKVSQVRLALIAGHFKKNDEEEIKKHLAGVGVDVYGPDVVAAALLGLLESKTYKDDSVVMTLKLFKAADRLKEKAG